MNLLHWLHLDQWWRTVSTGLKSLWLHRLRSLLTVMGIVFGVCSVIAMLAVGEGASFEAQQQIRRLGSTNIILTSMKPVGQEPVSSEQSYVLEYGLTYKDLDNIQESIPGVTIVVPGRIINDHVWNATRRVDITILGTVWWYPQLRGLSMVEGRYFSRIEMEANKNVCVISKRVSHELFPVSSPLGRNVRVGSDYYKVVGVIAGDTGRGAVELGSEDSSSSKSTTSAEMYIPLTAAKKRFGEVLIKRRSGSMEAERVQLHEAIARVANQEDVEETAAIIEQIMARTHKKKDYAIVVPLELLRQAERTKQIFNVVLGAIAAISLIVGGIGIMNIMLASVTERTREIGIRRALGARKRDIVVQFLVETVILSAAGGVIGVLLGIAIPLFIEKFAGMQTIVTFWAPAVAFSISGLVGVVFGIYPAVRAANMDPVEALRHE